MDMSLECWAREKGKELRVGRETLRSREMEEEIFMKYYCKS